MGKEAAAEFQKILDHSGIVWNCWTGALAHLGVARGDALEAKTEAAVVCVIDTVPWLCSAYIAVARHLPHQIESVSAEDGSTS